MDKAKEIIVISGKGGTGKTTVTACLADIIPNKVIVDTDVDAANLHILMKPSHLKGMDFKGKPVAVIDTEKCISCGRCKGLCRFNAIDIISGIYRINQLSCDGCTLCQLACPTKAVTMEEQTVGKWFESKTEWGDFIYARLIPGAENSGTLVTKVKNQAKILAGKKQNPMILIDGPPGIGCPVISAISGTNLALIVTEPTYSGINDLKRVLQLTTHFGIKSAIVINRYNVNRENSKKIEKYAKERGIPIYGKIPHDHCIRKEISNRNLPSRRCRQLAEQIGNIYEKIQSDLN